MPDTVQMAPGMLLYEPAGIEHENSRAHVWVVEKVNRASAWVLCYVDGTCSIRARLTQATIPDGWFKLNHDALVAFLAPRHAEAMAERRAMEHAASLAADRSAGEGRA